MAARLVLAAAVLALLVASPARAASLDWRSCSDGFGADCARLAVPLDRSGTLPGTISLRVARMPGPASRPTLVYLSGGPGGGGLDELESVLWTLSGLTGGYRVVAFDQRGTGRSGLLRCPALERDLRLRSTAAGAACGAGLGAARAHYTTADSVADLEAVRAALGVDRLTLFGISYGTELALAYARAHPDHVARLALDSLVDPDDRDPFGLAGFRAMGPSLAALCPAGCAGVTADPARDLARLAARLRRAPMAGRVLDAYGHAHARELTEVRIADLLYDTDYAPALRAGMPAAIQAALHGDPQPMLRLTAAGDALATLPPPAEFSAARYATTCEETPLPWDPGTPVGERWAEAERRAAALGPNAFLPFDFRTAAADEIELCLHWPGVPRAASRRAPGGQYPDLPAGVATGSPYPGVPAGVATGGPYPDVRAGVATGGPYPDVPALILQGGEDLRTPPEVSARVAAALPGATRVLVPGVGHGTVTADPTGCAAGTLLRFLGGEAVAGNCPRVPTQVPAVALSPRSLAAVAPLPGRAPMRVRRLKAAIGLTLDDVRFALSPALAERAGGGLRGGSFAAPTRTGLELAGYEAVGGVRLTGRWERRRLRLHVLVTGAPGGSVTIDPRGGFTGTLLGHRVTGRLPNRPPHPRSQGQIAVR
jgi:pimeloyl-ACP methyl ester carboxylesterase